MQYFLATNEKGLLHSKIISLKVLSSLFKIWSLSFLSSLKVFTYLTILKFGNTLEF